MYRKQATPYLDRIQSLKALIAHGTWGPATTEADFLLVDQYIPDREYVQTCFAQAFIMAELAESMDDLFRFEKGKSASVKVRAQSFRNAISFIMEGLNRAVEKQLVDLIVMAASCYFKLSLDAIINKQWCYIIMVPLASLVKHLIVCKKECADYFTQASLLLSDLILHMLEEKDTTKAQEVLPWPTNDEYTVFLSAANQTILTSLENALSEILQHPKENNLQFIVVRNYLRHLRLNPTSKSTQIENLLQNDTIMKTFSSIHASTPTSINDTASIMKAVDNKMQQTHNCDHVFAFLLDLAEYAIKTDSSKLCKEVLEKMKLMQPSSKLNIRRELVQLQLELNESAKIESGNPHKTSYNLKRLSHAIRQGKI
ncbi:hypothetical protein BC830DRAFT_462126 [Chytriomyces sp. MP71]|nr:hypothetical protein BC830DRAFT_462126 [Chytriomyces sp. MP71]